MHDSQPGFFTRLTLALRAFGRILTESGFAGDVLRLELTLCKTEDHGPALPGDQPVDQGQ